MKMKLAALIMLLTVFAMPAVDDDVDKMIQNLNDTDRYDLETTTA